jgi:PAS domain S-box-containing protein
MSVISLEYPSSAKLKLFTQSAAAVVIAVGALVFVGWAFGVGGVRSLAPGLTPMKVNTALGLVLAGLALLLNADEHAGKWRRRAAMIASGVVTLLGSLTLSQYLLGADYGIDQVFFREAPGAVLTAHPGRMGMGTAFNFIMIGLVLLMLDRRERWLVWLGQGMALAALIVALAALLGYGYGVIHQSGPASSANMAIHTALTFIILGAGTLSARPKRPLMALFTSKSAGGVLARRIWLQMMFLMPLLGWLRLVGERVGLYESHIGTALFVLAMSVIFSLLAWRVARALDRSDAERKEAEEAERGTDARLRVALMSIGDAVITTDAACRVILLNRVAEALTGWTQVEAEGRSLEQVFSIVSEQTRAEIENPVTTVIRERRTVGLANHAVLIAKDGRETPIDGSGAPIHDEQNGIAGAALVFRDISERRRAERTQLRLAAIVQSSDDAIISKDLNGVIMSWNTAAERLFGYTEAEAVGQSITLIIPPELRDEETQILARLRAGDMIDHYQTTRVSKTGQRIEVSLTISLMKDAAGQIIGASKIARDITQEKRLLEGERIARQQAEAANRLKDEFLATVSHELRTPLNHMLGWVALLRAGALTPEKTAEALETIERNVRAQNRLVEDLLDVSRIVTGKMQLHVRPVIPASVVEAAVASARPAAEAKGVRIQTILDSAPGTISGDPDRLQQVVWNLVSNAIKFTPKGGRVQVRLERINSRVEITISDTGEGIDPEFLPYVFNRFSQADGSFKRKHSGLGLGLAIVRHLVELHGGEVSAESPGPGQGATFIIKLPLAAANARLKELEHAAPEVEGLAVENAPQLGGVRVLVVDDEADARKLLTAIFTSSGADVRAVGGMAEALRAIGDWRPDVLVSDIGMPEGDGYDLIREIRRADASGQRLPAVALTAYARTEDRMRALAAGFQMHVAKPVEPQELLMVVANLAGRTI